MDIFKVDYRLPGRWQWDEVSALLRALLASGQAAGITITMADPMTVDEFFSGREESRRIFDTLHSTIDLLGPAEVRVTKSQVAFRRNKTFAWAWAPDMYLHGGHAPLVLTLSFPRRDDSPCWKEIVEPAPGRFTHHLELYSDSDIDGEVRRWLREAWERA